MPLRPYNDPEYRAAVDHLRLHPCECYRCAAPATTIDHVPPVGLHTHVRGSGCCYLRPACPRHNYGAGANIAALRRGSRKRATWSRRW